jgi:hypothetical protein
MEIVFGDFRKREVARTLANGNAERNLKLF